MNRPSAGAGDICGVALAVPFDSVHRGSVLVKKGDSLKGCTEFVCQIKLLPGCPRVKKGYAPFVLLCTGSFCGRVVELISKADSHGAVQEQPVDAGPGDTLTCRMIAHEPVAIDTFVACPPLGRFAVRDGNHTVALGIVKSCEAVVTHAAPKVAGKKGGRGFF